MQDHDPAKHPEHALHAHDQPRRHRIRILLPDDLKRIRNTAAQDPRIQDRIFRIHNHAECRLFKKDHRQEGHRDRRHQLHKGDPHPVDPFRIMTHQ